MLCFLTPGPGLMELSPPQAWSMAVAEGKSIKNSFLALKVWAESDVLLLAMYGPKQVPCRSWLQAVRKYKPIMCLGNKPELSGDVTLMSTTTKGLRGPPSFSLLFIGKKKLCFDCYIKKKDRPSCCAEIRFSWFLIKCLSVILPLSRINGSMRDLRYLLK